MSQEKPPKSTLEIWEHFKNLQPLFAEPKNRIQPVQPDNNKEKHKEYENTQYAREIERAEEITQNWK